MAASSKTLTEKGSTSTGKTAKVTAGQALEILQEAVRQYQNAGGRVSIVPLPNNGEPSIGIVLVAVVVDSGNFVAINGKEG